MRDVLAAAIVVSVCVLAAAPDAQAGQQQPRWKGVASVLEDLDLAVGDVSGCVSARDGKFVLLVTDQDGGDRAYTLKGKPGEMLRAAGRFASVSGVRMGSTVLIRSLRSTNRACGAEMGPGRRQPAEAGNWPAAPSRDSDAKPEEQPDVISQPEVESPPQLGRAGERQTSQPGAARPPEHRHPAGRSMCPVCSRPIR